MSKSQRIIALILCYSTYGLSAYIIDDWRLFLGIFIFSIAFAYANVISNTETKDD